VIFKPFSRVLLSHTKRVHILLSQYKTRTRATLGVQNVWATRATRLCKY